MFKLYQRPNDTQGCVAETVQIENGQTKWNVIG